VRDIIVPSDGLAADPRILGVLSAALPLPDYGRLARHLRVYRLAGGRLNLLRLADHHQRLTV